MASTDDFIFFFFCGKTSFHSSISEIDAGEELTLEEKFYHPF